MKKTNTIQTSNKTKVIYKDIVVAPIGHSVYPLYTFSFFSGVRGLDIGAKKAGYTSLFQSDWWQVGGKAFELNIPVAGDKNHPSYLHSEGVYVSGRNYGDINNISFELIQKYIRQGLSLNIPQGRVDVIHGGPPCQGFSNANLNKKEFEPKNFLIFQLLRIINESKPKVGLIEQVPMLFSQRFRSIWSQVKIALESMTDYYWDYKVMNAKHYGARQSRKRAIIMLVRKDLGILPSFPEEKQVDLTKVAVQSLLPHVHHFSAGQFNDIIKPANDIFCTMTATGSEQFYGVDGKRRNLEMWERLVLTELEGLKLDGIARTHQKTLVGNMVQVSFAEALFLHIKRRILKRLD